MPCAVSGVSGRNRRVNATPTQDALHQTRDDEEGDVVKQGGDIWLQRDDADHLAGVIGTSSFRRLSTIRGRFQRTYELYVVPVTRRDRQHNDRRNHPNHPTKSHDITLSKNRIAKPLYVTRAHACVTRHNLPIGPTW